MKWVVNRFVVPSCALVALMGCAGLTRSKNESALRKVKSVAVAGFAVRAPANALTGGTFVPQESAEVDEMYDSFVKSITKKLRWATLAPGKMKQNSGYQRAFDSTMKGFQNKMPPGAGMKQYVVSGIMDDNCLRIMGVEGRNKLMNALKVDALLTVSVDVILSGTTIAGFGNRYPHSRVAFWLFTRDSSTPDWFEGNLQGDESKISVGATALIDEALLRKLALESARTAYAKLKP